MISPTRILSTGLVVATLALSGCGSDKKSSTGTNAPADTGAPGTAASGAAAGGAVLTIKDFAFSAATAVAGETISITNEDGAAHTVTADDGSFDVPVGTSAELVIPAAGSYPIHCEIHTSMTGTIVVE